MAERTDTIEIIGDGDLLDAGYLAIAKANGWREKIVVEGFEVDNPSSPKEFSMAVTKKFWRDTILNYNANVAAELARNQIYTQSGLALDTLTIGIKDVVE